MRKILVFFALEISLLVKSGFISRIRNTLKKLSEKRWRQSKTDSHQTKLVTEEESSLQPNEDLCSIFQVSKPKHTPLLKIKIIVNETPVQMKVNTGASISLLNFNTYNALKAEENELLPTFGWEHIWGKLLNQEVNSKWNFSMKLMLCNFIISNDSSYNHVETTAYFANNISSLFEFCLPAF